MTKISRSVYQKLAEENKKLLRDIRILVMDDTLISINCMMKWREKFKKEKYFNEMLKAAAKQYIKEHSDELPEFLTKDVDK